MSKIQEDLVELKTKLKAYVDEGRRIGYGDIKRQPLIITKPDITLIIWIMCTQQTRKNTRFCGFRAI